VRSGLLVKELFLKKAQQKELFLKKSSAKKLDAASITKSI